MKTNIEKRQCVIASPELRDAAAGMPTIVGYAAKFNSRSELIMGYFQEQIAKGAFSDTIANDDIRALVDHDSGKILGRNRAKTLRLFEDDIGLGCEITPPDTTTARDLITSIRRGDISGMSFAFRTESDTWDFGNGKTPLRTLNKVSIQDVSVVTYPAYPATEVDVRSYEKAMAAFNGKSVDMAARQLRAKAVLL